MRVALREFKLLLDPAGATLFFVEVQLDATDLTILCKPDVVSGTLSGCEPLLHLT